MYLTQATATVMKLMDGPWQRWNVYVRAHNCLIKQRNVTLTLSPTTDKSGLDLRLMVQQHAANTTDRMRRGDLILHELGFVDHFKTKLSSWDDKLSCCSHSTLKLKPNYSHVSVLGRQCAHPGLSSATAVDFIAIKGVFQDRNL